MSAEPASLPAARPDGPAAAAPQGGPGSTTVDQRRLVLGAGLLMVVAHLVHRGWAVFAGWFYADDYTLLVQARGQRFDVSYVAETYSGHLLPGGRVFAWLVSNSGALDYQLAASLTFAVQVLTCLAAAWMFFTVFDVRWAALAPLALYLSTAMTLPAYVWWGAALLQQPTQLAFFLAVGAWVRYLRDREVRWALLAYAGVGVGVLFDIKALVVLPVLAYLALAYFADGGPVQRVRQVLVRYRVAAAVGGVLVVAYLVLFFSVVPDTPAQRPGAALLGRILSTSALETVPTALLGGPWRWDQNGVQPTSSADPPTWTVQLTWVVLAVVVLYGALRRHRSLRAWGVLLVSYACAVGLLLVARATLFGPGVASEYRFFTDVGPPAALAVGLAFLRLPGAPQSSRPRDEPLLTVAVGRRVVVALVAVVSVLGLVSQTTYTRTFHGALGSESYMRNLDRGLTAVGKVDLVDRELPERVSPPLIAPWNRVSVMTRLLSDQVSFPEATSSLAVVADDGSLHEAEMEVSLDSLPGPREGCGWLVRGGALDLPLSAPAIPYVWWMKIGYLSGADSPLTVSAGESVVETQVEEGLGELWVRVTGTFDSVRFSGLDRGVSVCVDTIDLGQPVPGSYL